MSGQRPLRHWMKQVPCMYLMLALIAQVLIYPLFLKDPVGLLTLNSLVLVTGVYAVTVSRERVAMAVALTGAQVLTSFLCVHLHMQFFYIPSMVLLAIILAYTIAVVLAYVIVGGSVTRDQIFGAVSVYLLAGFMFGNIYAILLYYNPNALGGATDADVIYFSFVTLCTIGYGDIRPVAGLTRSVAILEGVTGVFYVAVLVSRLVSRSVPSDEARHGFWHQAGPRHVKHDHDDPSSPGGQH